MFPLISNLNPREHDFNTFQFIKDYYGPKYGLSY